MRHPFTLLAGVALFALSPAPLAAVNDVFPADYVLPGSTTLTSYLYHRDYSGPYRDGQDSAGASATMSVAAMRLSHPFEAGRFPASLMLVASGATADVDPGLLPASAYRDTAGFGDLRVGATLWLKADRQAGRYLGATTMLMAPTGRYDPRRAVNAGDNRWAATFMLGLIEPLNRDWTLELIPEIAWYGDNDDYLNGNRLEQDASYSLTSYLGYRATASTRLHLGGQLNRGGKTRLNGRDLLGESDSRRAYLGLTHYFDSRTQFIIRIGADQSIDNGLRLDREVVLRLLKLF